MKEKLRLKKQFSTTQKIALAALFVALKMIGGQFAVPLPTGTRVSFIPDFVNILAGVLIGPVYAFASSFISSVIRVALGTATPFTFVVVQGSLLVALAFKYTKNIQLAAIADILGVVLVGGLIGWPVAVYLLGREAGPLTYVLSFAPGAISGSILGAVFLNVPVIKNALFEKIGATDEKAAEESKESTQQTA